MSRVNDTTNRAKYVTYWEYLDPNLGPVNPGSISSDLGSKYSEEIIARAAMLKGYNNAYYSDCYAQGLTTSSVCLLSDEDYVRFALQEQYEAIVKSIGAMYDLWQVNMGVIDPEWAIYSYEEIIDMENNGVKIPDEVLKWAHAQQQADAGTYSIISENSEAVGDAGNGAGEDNSIDSLKDKAKKCTQEAEKAVEDTKALFEDYEAKAEVAKQIKNAKEETYESEMDEITNLTDEWKALDQKSKTGKLSKSESKRFQELGKKLNGKNGTLMSEMLAMDAQLDDYLNSFTMIDTKVQENEILIADTTKAAKDLLELEKSFSSEVLPHSTTERATDSGLLVNILHGVKGDSIAEVAMVASQDLTECNEDVSSVIYNSENSALTQFSTDYTTEASKTEENTKEVMGDAFNQASPELGKDKVAVDSGIPIIFSFANAMFATAKTLATTIELKTMDKKTMSSNKSLLKELSKSDKEMKSLNKEVSVTESKQEVNAEEEETFLAQLEEIKAGQDEEIEPSVDDGSGETAPVDNSETEDIYANLETLDKENEQSSKSLQKAVGKSLAVTKKSQKLSKLLRGESTDLEKQKNLTVKTAGDTMVVGVGTTAQGIVTTGIATTICATASSMIMTGFPPAVSAGIQLLQQGLLLLAVGQLEMTTGITASVTGAASLVISSNVEEDLKETDDSQKDATQLAKENQQAVKTASAVAANDGGKEGETSSEAAPATPSLTEDSTSNAAATQKSQIAVSTNTEDDKASDEDIDLNDESGEPGSTDSSTESVTSGTTATSTTGSTTTSTTGSTTDATTSSNAGVTTTGSDAATAADDAQKEASENDGNNYKIIFGASIPHNIAAMAVTGLAITDVLNDENEMDKMNEQYLRKLKGIETISKGLVRQQSLIQKLHEKLALKAESLTGEINSANATIAEASETGDQDKAAVAELDAQNASKELVTTVEAGTKDNKFDKSITQANKQMKVLDKEAKNIEGGLTKFDKNIDNLTSVSTETMAIGGTTFAFGSFMLVIGLLAKAVALASIPTNIPLLASSKLVIKDGINHMAVGGSSIAVGGAGLLARNEAKSRKKDIETKFKEGLPKAREGHTIVRQTKSSVKATVANTQSSLAMIPEVVTSSAAASANTNTANSYESDDKIDRKLARFNNDSIIESKKKKKKVQGVSASSRG